MRILKFTSNKLNTIRCSVVTLIFFQMLARTVCANVLCNQKDDGGACKEFVSGWNKSDYFEIRDVIKKENQITSRLESNYVSKYTIEELLELKVRKTTSNDLDMDPEKSGTMSIVRIILRVYCAVVAQLSQSYK